MYDIVVPKEIYKKVFNMLYQAMQCKPHDRRYLWSCRGYDKEVICRYISYLHTCNVLTTRTAFDQNKDYLSSDATDIEPKEERLRFDEVQLLKWLDTINENIDPEAVYLEPEFERNAYEFLQDVIRELSGKIIRSSYSYLKASAIAVPDVPPFVQLDAIESFQP